MPEKRPAWINFFKKLVASDRDETIVIDGERYTSDQIKNNPDLQRRYNQATNSYEHGYELGNDGLQPDSDAAQRHSENINDPHLREEFLRGLEDGKQDHDLPDK